MLLCGCCTWFYSPLSVSPYMMTHSFQQHKTPFYCQSQNQNQLPKNPKKTNLPGTWNATIIQHPLEFYFLGFQKRDNNNSHLLVVLKLEMASRAVTMKSNAVIDLSGGIESIRVQLQSLSVLPFPILLMRFLRPCQSTHPAERPLPNNTLLPTLLPHPHPTPRLSASHTCYSSAATTTTTTTKIAFLMQIDASRKIRLLASICTWSRELGVFRRRKQAHAFACSYLFHRAQSFASDISSSRPNACERASERARPLIRPRYLDEALDKAKVLWQGPW